MIALLAFAFVAGSVATVNPCGFALLPAYLARRLAIHDDALGLSEAVVRALIAGAVMTVGFVLIFGLAGGAIMLGAGWLMSVFPWAGLVIGVMLIIAGLAVLSGRSIGLSLVPHPSSAAGGLRGDLVFGLGYGTASLSCTLPIFMAVMGTTTTDGLLSGALSLVAYALGMGTVVVSLAIGAALSRNGVAAAFRGLLPYLTRAGGALLSLSGLYVAYYWGYGLFSETIPTENNAIVIGGRLSSTLMTWLGGSTGLLGTHGVLALILVLSAWFLGRRLYSRARGRSREAGLPNEHRVGLSTSTMED